MAATYQLFLMFGYGIPLVALYVLVILALMAADPAEQFQSTYYTFVVVGGILNLATYLISIITYRLPIFMLFYNFFHDFEASWKTSVIYGLTYYLCCTVSFTSVMIAFTRFSSLVFGQKVWSGRSVFLAVVIILIGPAFFVFYQWDTEIVYQRVPLEDGSYVFIMVLDIEKREWVSEVDLNIGWALGLFLISLATYIMIFYNRTCGSSVEVERKETFLTKLAVVVLFSDCGYVTFQVVAKTLDRDDIMACIVAARQAAASMPYLLDMRIFSTPLLLFLFDSALRNRILFMIGIRSKGN